MGFSEKGIASPVKKIIEVAERNSGLLLVTSAQAFFSLMNVAVKKLNRIDPPVPTLELVFARMSITYMCCIPCMLFAGIPDPILGPQGVRLLLLFRGLAGFLGLFGVYYSLQYLSLSDATAITFIGPVGSGITGYIFLREPYTRVEAIAGFSSLLGVVLIARPPFLFGEQPETHIPDDPTPLVTRAMPESPELVSPHQRVVAVGVALLGCVGAMFAYTTVRGIGTRAHALHSLSSFAFQSSLFAGVSMVIMSEDFVFPTQLESLTLLALIGVFGFAAQWLLTLGLQRETVARGTIAVYTQVIFASILEQIFFRTVPTLLSICGTLIVLVSALYVALSKESTKCASLELSMHIMDVEGPPEGLLASGPEYDALLDSSYSPTLLSKSLS